MSQSGAIFLVIGDELLSGHTREVNAYWLGKFLKQFGQVLSEVRVISDHLEHIEKTVKESLSSYQLIVLSGGLGPTEDDLTEKALEKVLGRGALHPLENRVGKVPGLALVGQGAVVDGLAWGSKGVFSSY